MKLEITVAGI